MSRMTVGKLERKIEALKVRIDNHRASLEKYTSRAVHRLITAVVNGLEKEMAMWQEKRDNLKERIDKENDWREFNEMQYGRSSV